MQATKEKRDWKKGILNNPIWQLAAAGAVVVAVLIAVLIPRRSGGDKTPTGGEIAVPTATHTLTGEGRGTLALCDAAHPQSREDCLAAGMECLPAGWHAASGYAIGGASILD